MKIRVIDVETTGLSPTGDRVVEIAFVQLPESDESSALFFQSLVNPGISIPPTASAIHHIVDSDVAESPALGDVLASISEQHGEADVYVAHNARFDRSFLPDLHNKPWVCTLQLARRLWPDAPKHSNQVLRYWLNLNIPLPKNTPMHRALSDAIVTAQIFKQVRAKLKDQGIAFNTPAEMESYINRPIPLKKKSQSIRPGGRGKLND